MCSLVLGIVLAARAHGLDTLQFLHHADQVCDMNIAIEIVDLAASGLRTCASDYRSGWEGAHACRCREDAVCANCETGHT